ncbi:atrial natriuretic peptide receptor 1-like [Paramacrobiotus metropolitanus]|uniref:atrial natriuretic peptide receptor 1-like n=1 Tax=Paramacrobiotus metropolitanus TaxID=2943436 RepID=UPI002446253C|nr:atrial natriuretic peptide receptor 1-like [Paramacrobiotus metropolitanus]
MEVVKWSNYLYGGNGNLAEKILWRLSQHSEDLEEEVLRRTTNLLDERAKCDAILARFLPSSVVRQLRSGSNVIPEMFELVTLMFTDMPDFGAYVARHPPLRATTVLAELDMLFHALLSQYAVYRVENISDSYMIASGVPVANGTQNVLEICSLAQAVMRRAPEKLSVYQELPIKVGIHSGPLAAGVIGTKKPKYCLFGNTVNIASRMCSHGISGRIQLSDSTADVARTVYPQLMLEERGWIAVKGAGEMQTFWLQF